ncbi:MAG: isoprenylcysteine carboxylmethyltransferase family protein [Melioribacteraceae bacterium]|nr:isoprenylcysteine carboxylmethyltransferase family protein [Melioribacteraceae bacterium]
MIYLFDIVIIISLFFGFGIIHIILASTRVKIWVTNLFDVKIAFYRIFYNISSIILLIIVYSISPKPDLIIYDLSFPFDIVIFGLQILSLSGFVWTLKFIDGKEFLGTSQIKRWLNGAYDKTDLDESSEFITDGSYKYSRHPIYFFSILFLGLRPVMDLFYLTMFCSFIIYCYVGSYFEEQRLINKFGEQYLEYQSRVPRIFPLIFRNKK